MSALDQHVAPMLAVAGTLPQRDDEWAFEVKWDGVRAVVYAEPGGLRMESRNRIDITARYPELHGLGDALRGHAVVIDAEVVAFDDAGRPDFGRLQHRMHVTGERDVRLRMTHYPVVLMAFDLLWLDGELTVSLPYEDRRALLAKLALDGPQWQTPAHHVGDGPAMLASAKERRLEGVMAKKLDSPYEPGRRSRSWLKVKSQARQEVVVGGWVEGSGNRAGRIGALLVGYYDGDVLRFAGKVGTGYTDRVLADLAQRLAPLARPTSPFGTPVPVKGAQFVDPVLVAEVEFTEWTANDTLRHPSYKGLRDDKPARDVVREPFHGGQ